MKRSKLLLSFYVLALNACYQKGSGSFNIEGYFANAPDGEIYLDTIQQSYMPIDSTYVKGGRFSFHGEINEEILAQLRFRKGDRRLMFILDTGSIKFLSKKYKLFDIYGKHVNVIGSPKTRELWSVYAEHLKYYIARNKIRNIIHLLQLKGGNQKSIAQQESLLDSLKKSADNYSLNIALNTNSPQCRSAALLLFDTKEDILMVKNRFVRAMNRFPKSASTRILRDRYENAMSTFDNILIPGTTAPDFMLWTPQHEEISLNNFVGKYILLNFWASWCVPCRKENPIFIKIYNQFKKKKFTIIGISLDKDSTKWINAIKNDHLPWIQISDLKGHQSKVGYEYGINAIPANFLIGPHKEIIAVNLTAEELTVKLDSIFNKKR